MTTYVQTMLTVFYSIFDGKTLPHLGISRYDTGHVIACTGSDGSRYHWVVPWNILFSFQLPIIIFWWQNLLIKPSVALVVYLQFTSCTQGWHNKLLRDRSLHLLAKGSVTILQFSKKNVVSVHAPELPFCIALNHLTRTLNTHHRTATTIYLLQHWSDRGYVGSLNPKQA